MIVSLGLSDWKRLLSADGKYNRRDNDAKQLHDYIREIENQYFNEISNPLGVEPETIIELGIQTAPPGFLEYKFSFDALIQDFDNEDKHPKDLGLVVVWTMGKGRWKERFQTNILDGQISKVFSPNFIISFIGSKSLINTVFSSGYKVFGAFFV